MIRTVFSPSAAAQMAAEIDTYTAAPLPLQLAPSADQGLPSAGGAAPSLPPVMMAPSGYGATVASAVSFAALSVLAAAPPPAAAAVVDLASARPPALTSAQREERVRTADDPKLVEYRLTEDIRRAAAQMAREPTRELWRYAVPLPGQIDFPIIHEEQTIGAFRVGMAFAKGWRVTMEDAHSAIDIRVTIGSTEYPIQVFGVFDGHGGREVAEYVRENIGGVLRELLVQHNRGGLANLGIYNALKHLGVRLQANFERDRPGHARAQGTCLTAAIILNGRLYTVNIGDSRITLVSPAGDTQQLTADQKPEDEYFERMIVNRGGYVSWGRVNGNLATARAIGDSDVNAVSARAKVSDHGPLVSGSIIVVACDGIYEVSTSRQLGGAVHANRATAPGELARNLVHSSIESRDNLSLMLVVVP